MADKDLTIDHILEDWTFSPDMVTTRVISNGKRQVIQLRVDMGLLQMEVEGRPDGDKPFGFVSTLDWIRGRELDEDEFKLDFEQCMAVDREFSQFYHRRICWIQLKKFAEAARDANHTLALMDACMRHSPNQEWTLSHEQHRPFVIFHRTQSLALQRVSEGENAEQAIEEINAGLKLIEDFFDTYEIEEDYEDDELVKRLIEIREDLRDRFEVGQTLEERLEEAVASEQFELAARLRDEIQKRK